MDPTIQKDRVIWRHQLQEIMGVTSETIRRWINAKQLPEPDVAMSRKTMGWRLSTLHTAGIKITA